MVNNLYLHGKYTKAELGEILGVDLNDTHNTGQNMGKLAHWGYTYTRKDTPDYIITLDPKNLEGRIYYLAERYLDLPRQTNIMAFAIYCYLLKYDTEFPLISDQGRSYILNKRYKMPITSRTIHRWQQKLTELTDKGPVFEEIFSILPDLIKEKYGIEYM